MTIRERLEELYTAALKAEDIHLALEIADRIKLLPVVGEVTVNHVSNFTKKLDGMIHVHENDCSNEKPETFVYGGYTFKVDIIDN